MVYNYLLTYVYCLTYQLIPIFVTSVKADDWFRLISKNIIYLLSVLNKNYLFSTLFV